MSNTHKHNESYGAQQQYGPTKHSHKPRQRRRWRQKALTGHTWIRQGRWVVDDALECPNVALCCLSNLERTTMTTVAAAPAIVFNFCIHYLFIHFVYNFFTLQWSNFFNYFTFLRFKFHLHHMQISICLIFTFIFLFLSCEKGLSFCLLNRCFSVFFASALLLSVSG